MKKLTIEENEERLMKTLNANAKRKMKSWNLKSFQNSHPTLLKVILQSMIDVESKVHEDCITDFLKNIPSDEKIKEISDLAFPPRDNVNIPKNEACILGMKTVNKLFINKYAKISK